MPNQFTSYRWRKEFGGLKTDQVKRLNELEKDRARCSPSVRECAGVAPLVRANPARASGGGTEEDQKGVQWTVCPTKLKVPQKQPKTGRLWLNDGSCIRLRPERPNHVWSYDFVEARTVAIGLEPMAPQWRLEGSSACSFGAALEPVALPLLTIDEFSRECLAIRIDRRLRSTDVIDVLSDLFMPRAACRITYGPTTARSSSPRRCGTGSPPSAQPASIAPGHSSGKQSPRLFSDPPHTWENGYCESFNSKLRDGLLNGEIFYSLAEAKIIIES